MSYAPDTLKQQIAGSLNLAQSRIKNLIENYPGLYPLYTTGGKWKHNKPGWTAWCDGFLPGMMWLLLESKLSNDPDYWRAAAEKHTTNLSKRKDDKEIHTHGFIFYFGGHRRWYETAKSEGKSSDDIFSIMSAAARTLMGRYNEMGQYLRSFLNVDSMVIDAVMNLPLLYYVGEKTGDARMKDVATQIAITCRRRMVRGDGSTTQQCIFDTRTGECLKQTTEQGFRADSCWSRGVAWSLYGFGLCYGMSQDPRFLETAELNARYIMENSPADGVPPWDYDAPESGLNSRKNVDSSAAAITACGLFNLANVTHKPDSAMLYRDMALNIVNTLTKPPYLTVEQPGWEGILKRGIYHIHKGLGVDESVMWGEYYFVESMIHALNALSQEAPE